MLISRSEFERALGESNWPSIYRFSKRKQPHRPTNYQRHQIVALLNIKIEYLSKKRCKNIGKFEKHPLYHTLKLYNHIPNCMEFLRIDELSKHRC